MSVETNSVASAVADEPIAMPVPAPLPAATTPQYRKVIEPPSGWPSLNLGEVWRYRDLLLVLVWRDISANYRQSVIGYGWALFKPVTT